MNCMICGKPLERCEQHWTHKPDVTILLTCRTPGCTLENVTASEPAYIETARAFLAAPPAVNHA